MSDDNDNKLRSLKKRYDELKRKKDQADVLFKLDAFLRLWGGAIDEVIEQVSKFCELGRQKRLAIEN